MRNIIDDFKVIGTIIIFSIMYSFALRKGYNVFEVVNLVDMMIIFSFSIYILSHIIYKFHYKYTNNIYISFKLFLCNRIIIIFVYMLSSEVVYL